MSSTQSQTSSKKSDSPSQSTKEKIPVRDTHPKEEREKDREREKEKKRKDPEDAASETESDYTDSEYSELDLTDNPMYQVLSAFFEDEEGNNICSYLKELTDAVRENTKMVSKLIKESDSKKQRH